MTLQQKKLTVRVHNSKQMQGEQSGGYVQSVCNLTNLLVPVTRKHLTDTCFPRGNAAQVDDGEKSLSEMPVQLNPTASIER